MPGDYIVFQAESQQNKESLRPIKGEFPFVGELGLMWQGIWKQSVLPRLRLDLLPLAFLYRAHHILVSAPLKLPPYLLIYPGPCKGCALHGVLASL